MLRKLATAAGLAAVALSLLTSPAAANEPAQADLWKSSDFSAGLSSTTMTASDYSFRYVGFGRSQSWDGPMTASASYYESVMLGGTSYTVSGSLEGQKAMAAYTLQGLNGGELHAVIPLKVCSYDYNTWEETCVASSQRVDATVTPVAQRAPDQMRFSIPKAPGCAGCRSEMVARHSRAAEGTLSVDGVPTTGPVTAGIGHNLGFTHMLSRPALSTTS